ncbi:MAG: hypothetical protein WC604_00785 [Candidatus Gracilibacteria bacterium]
MGEEAIGSGPKGPEIIPLHATAITVQVNSGDMGQVAYFLSCLGGGYNIERGEGGKVKYTFTRDPGVPGLHRDVMRGFLSYLDSKRAVGCGFDVAFEEAEQPMNGLAERLDTATKTHDAAIAVAEADYARERSAVKDALQALVGKHISAAQFSGRITGVGQVTRYGAPGKPVAVQLYVDNREKWLELSDLAGIKIS